MYLNTLSTESDSMDESLEEDEVNFLRRRKVNAALRAALESEDEEESTKPKIKKTRKVFERPKYWESCWGKMLKREGIDNPCSKEGKLFRRRFRVPYRLFEGIVERARVWFPQHDCDVVGKPSGPIELKVSRNKGDIVDFSKKMRY